MDQAKIETLHLLKHIFQTKSIKARKTLFDSLSRKHLLLIGEILVNLLAGNLEVGSKEKEKLKKHRQLIRALSNRKTGYKVRRKLLLKFPTVVTKIFRLLLPLVYAFFDL